MVGNREMAPGPRHRTGKGPNGIRFRSIWRAVATLLCTYLACMVPAASQAASQLDNPETDSGWQVDPRGMRHFTGLSCPDQIDSMSRVKILSSDLDRIAGCIYQSPDGINAVLRSHPKGTSEGTAMDFAARYGEAGFTRIDASGVASSGVTFRLGTNGNDIACETLWRFAGKEMDYTLWLAYRLPSQSETIGPLLAAFIREIAKGR